MKHVLSGFFNSMLTLMLLGIVSLPALSIGLITAGIQNPTKVETPSVVLSETSQSTDSIPLTK